MRSTTAGRLLLIDPTDPPAPVDDLAANRDVVIVLTCPWHERDTRKLVERFEASVFSPPLESTGDDRLAAQIFTVGDRLPVGVEAYPGMEPNDLVLWIEGRQALVAGDTLIDRGRGFEFPSDWANKGVSRTRFSRRCARCSSCRSNSSCRRTGRPTAQRSSGPSPDGHAVIPPPHEAPVSPRPVELRCSPRP